MTRSDVIAHLKAAEPALKARGIASLFLFGSYARDEAQPNSDIDLFVAIAGGAHLTILDMLDAQAAIKAEMPDKEIFFVTRDEVVPFYLPTLKNRRCRIF